MESPFRILKVLFISNGHIIWIGPTTDIILFSLTYFIKYTLPYNYEMQFYTSSLATPVFMSNKILEN